MARRKKSTSKRTTTRRRRVGAVKMSGISDALFVIGGAAVGHFISKIIPVDKPVIKSGIVLAAGIFLPKFIKNPMLAKMAPGLVAYGGLNLLQNTGVLKGMPMLGGYSYNMLPEMDAVAGLPANEGIAGLPLYHRANFAAAATA